MEYFLVAAGFVMLIKGADWLVESAKEIAFSLGVSAFIVGMSVVAFGTSMPETAVGVMSGIQKTNELSLGDVVGSCIANVALILGTGALIAPLGIERKVLWVDVPISFVAQVVFFVPVVIGAALSRGFGILLLALFVLYCIYLFRSARVESAANVALEVEEGKPRHRPGVKTVLFLLLGLAGLVLGAKLVVDGATAIARQFGMSEALIGVTVVALGTSLPELITTIVASVRKHADIAVGNIIGSNIINICLVLGLTVTIRPIAVPPGVVVNGAVMLAVTAGLFALALPRKRLGRGAGAVLLAAYAAFIAHSVAEALRAA